MVDVLGVLDREAAAQAISQLIQTYSCLADLAQSQGELDCCGWRSRILSVFPQKRQWRRER